MPRLGHPKVVKGSAISALLKLYRNTPDFMREWDEIRWPYQTLLHKLGVDILAFWKRAESPPREYFARLIDYSEGKTQVPPFSTEDYPYGAQLQPYYDRLGDLAYKWKLRAPWALIVLYIYDIIDMLNALGVPEDAEISLEDLEVLYPWSPPVPAMEVKVPAWALILMGRKNVQVEIAKRLERYEEEIKMAGLSEYPSRLKKHAEWWFEHYVYKKKYDEIAQDEAHAVGGSLVSFARNVGAAVRRFSNLIGINPKALK